MQEPRPGGEPRDDETQRERLDRELEQLLNETRVAMPGVQVLFAFLLTVPFAAGYQQVDGFEKGVYVAALLTAALASVFFIAPSAYHRMVFRRGEKGRLVGLANGSILVGLVFLALAMNASILLVLTVVTGRTAAIAVTAVTTLVFAGLWFGVALGRRVQDG